MWNAAASLTFVIVPDALREGNTPVLLALLSPLMGLGFLIWALRVTVRLLKYGTSTLELPTTPIFAGSALRGTLVTRLSSPVDVRLVVACARRDHSEENASGDVLWLEELPVSRSSGSATGEDSAAMEMHVRSVALPVDPNDAVIDHAQSTVNVRSGPRGQEFHFGAGRPTPP